MSNGNLEVKWQGPFTWPRFDSVSTASFDLIPINASGIYLWTYEYCDGYLIYAAGITRRPFQKRFREHTKNYFNGMYTILDMVSLSQGKRIEIWHGFWTKERSPEKLIEYESRRDEILEAARKQLSTCRVFVTPVDATPRILERLEAAIMKALYLSEGATSEIPDRGMQLAPRWPNEEPIVVRNTSSTKLHGLPECFVI